MRQVYTPTLMQVILEEGEAGSLRQVPLVIKGLTAAGYLSAADERGEVYELHPDGNRYGFSVPQTQCVTRCATLHVPNPGGII